MFTVIDYLFQVLVDSTLLQTLLIYIYIDIDIDIDRYIDIYR